MFNFLNISDSKALVPIALVALAGVFGYWIWSKAQANAAAANAANASDATGLVSGQNANLEDLALLSSLFGANSGSTTTSTTGQVTVTPGSTTTGTTTNGTAAPTQTAPTTSGSSTGNTVVTQGV
jgi:cytoskeletal protein RodZ